MIRDPHSEIVAASAIARNFSRLTTFCPFLVGSIGEVIAAEEVHLNLLPNSHPGHDAKDADGRFVQIKMTAGKSIAMYADCDRLVVLRIISPEQAEIVYDGPGAPAWRSKEKVAKSPSGKSRRSSDASDEEHDCSGVEEGSSRVDCGLDVL